MSASRFNEAGTPTERFIETRDGVWRTSGLDMASVKALEAESASLEELTLRPPDPVDADDDRLQDGVCVAREERSPRQGW